MAASSTKVKTAQKRAQRAIPMKGKRCETCGSGVALQRHHPNHNRPRRVRILCASCHGRLHAKRRRR